MISFVSSNDRPEERSDGRKEREVDVRNLPVNHPHRQNPWVRRVLGDVNPDEDQGPRRIEVPKYSATTVGYDGGTK